MEIIDLIELSSAKKTLRPLCRVSGEEVEVVSNYAGRCLKTKLPHSLIPEDRWMAPLLHVGGETTRVLCHLGRLVVVTNQILTTLH